MRVILTATVMSLPPGAAAARDDTNAKLVVGYVAAVSARELVIVLATDGSPGQRKGMQIRFTLTPETRVFEFERPATMGAIVVRREVTVTYDDAKGANVARAVRVLDMLPPGVAMPGVPGDAFVAELQGAAQSQGLNN